MNARELADWLTNNPITWRHAIKESDREVILRALRLLAAAEANDGTTPETDRKFSHFTYWSDRERELRVWAENLERERNWLAARVGELEPDAERYRWLLHQAPITDFIFKFLRSTERHVSNAIDAARSKP